MLEVLHEWLYAIRWLVLVLALIPLFIYGRVLARVLFAGADGDATPNRPTRPAMPLLRRALPVAQPRAPIAAPPAESAGSLDAGVSGHQQRGMAKTAKLPLASPAAAPVAPPTARASEPAGPSADDLAMEGLFGSAQREVTSATDAASQESVKEKPGSQRRTASRLEQLGFHQGADSGDPTKPIVPNEPPKTQTAELTNILERIDKFLAEDNPADAAAPAAPAAKPAAPPSRPPTTAAAPVDPGKKAPPLWARPDVMDEDVDVADQEKPADPPADDQGEDEPKGQQKLF
jgi:hypothetical protein